MATETAHYEIITRSEKYPEWANDAVGQPNEFDTEEAAWAAVEELRKLGNEWAEAEYSVRMREWVS